MLFLKKSFFLYLLFLVYFNSYSQIRPNSINSLSIGENGFMTIFGQHNFMSGTGLIKPGIIKVNRSSNPGFLIYGGESGWSGASEKQYIDGYVKSFHKNKFTYPIGHNGEYRPICLSDSYASSAAYYKLNPNKLSGQLSESVHKISALEYWSINLNQASYITLTWSNSSKIEELVENDHLEDLTIVGLNKENLWTVIPSEIDEYVLNISLHQGKFNKYTKSKQSLGSITSLEKLDGTEFKEFTLASLSDLSDFNNPSFNVYPNPQIVGTKINLDYDLVVSKYGTIRIFKSDNSLLYELKLSSTSQLMQLPYLIKESGSYILSLTDSDGKTSHQNLIVVDR